MLSSVGWESRGHFIFLYCPVIQPVWVFQWRRKPKTTHNMKKSVIFYSPYSVIWEWRSCHLVPAVYKHRRCWQLSLSCHLSTSIFLFLLFVRLVLCPEHPPAGDLQCQWHLNLDRLVLLYFQNQSTARVTRQDGPLCVFTSQNRHPTGICLGKSPFHIFLSQSSSHVRLLTHILATASRISNSS